MNQRTAEPVRRGMLHMLFAALGMTTALTTGVTAQDKDRGEDLRPAHRCGKAAAAARLMHTDLEALPSKAYLEVMEDTDVQHYMLDIEITDINPAGNTCTITGSNTMTIQSKSESLTQFTFRLREQFDITSAVINGSTPVSVSIASISTRVVTLDRAYGMDEVFDLTIEYTGPTVSAAFGSIEVDTHSGGIPVVATLSEPYYAYTWWPAKDGDLYLAGNNTDKATLDFWVTVADNFTVAANGILEDTETLPGNRKRFRWSSDYPIATYLVAFGVTEYNTWTATYTYPGGTMPVEFFIYPSLDSGYYRSQWEMCIDMLAVFRPLFGEYPFINEKYGIYNFPFGGGMEHQTITGQGGFSEWLTAHELAHQWWGDEVTCKTWNHIWLQEGFASYAEALWVEHKADSSGLPALKSYMAGMRYTGGGSVYVYDDEVDELWEIFNGNTSYDKGAWVYHMLRHVLGDQDFFDAVATYRATYAGSAATTEDLQAICEAYYGESLEWFFQQWIYGERAPSYTYAWTSAEVNGQDYLALYLNQAQDSSYQRFTMPIDIVVDGVTHMVFNDADAEHYVIPTASAPADVQVDPDAWVLWGSVSGTSFVPGPPKIVETEPAPGASVDYGELTDVVNIFFHKPVDAAPGDFSIVGDSTGHVSFTAGGLTNVNPVILNLDAPLLPDTYTLTVGDGIVELDRGLTLDGEIADAVDPGSLPSGDGLAGGDAVIRFTVSSSSVLGDFDGDGDVDLEDAAALMACFTGEDGGPVEPGCLPGDIDEDNDIDCADWAAFKIFWTGPDTYPPFQSQCDTDCNTNSVADEFDIDAGTSSDSDSNGNPDECDCSAIEVPLAEAVAMAKNRFLSLVPQSSGQQTALRVTVAALPTQFEALEGATFWVGEPFEVSESSGSNGPSPPNFTAARLQCQPYYTDWGAAGTVHVLHQAIIPGGTYDVQAIDEVCDTLDESRFSSAFRIVQSGWGDIVGDCGVSPCSGPDLRIDFIDISATVDKFRNLPDAPIKARADLAGETPDLVVDFVDISRAVDAFRGESYPFDGPSPCPPM